MSSQSDHGGNPTFTGLMVFRRGQCLQDGPILPRSSHGGGGFYLDHERPWAQEFADGLTERYRREGGSVYEPLRVRVEVLGQGTDEILMARPGVIVREDPFCRMIRAFSSLWPDKSADMMWTTGMQEETGGWGLTIFPDTGGPPLVQIDIEASVKDAVELLGHELAHVAAGPDAEHGPEWQAAFDRIHVKYHELLEQNHD